MQELDEVLLHFGTKGMKWGVTKSKEQLSRDYYDRDVVVKKGTVLGRTSNSTEKKTLDGRVYVAFTEKDKKEYFDRFGLLNHWAKKPTYQISLKATEDLIAPSRDVTVSEFMKLHKSDSNIAKEMAKHRNRREDKKKKLTSIGKRNTPR